MNRDLSKIILIDWDEQAYQLQPRNALHRLKKWEGNDNDTDLVYLASFLKCNFSSINLKIDFEDCILLHVMAIVLVVSGPIGLFRL